MCVTLSIAVARGPSRQLISGFESLADQLSDPNYRIPRTWYCSMAIYAKRNTMYIVRRMER